VTAVRRKSPQKGGQKGVNKRSAFCPVIGKFGGSTSQQAV
jgi:hypothetical protein